MTELDKLLKRFWQYSQTHCLISDNDKIVVAYSGGTDSTAMLYLLWKLRFMHGLTLLAVHINHQLRGEEANRDEDFAKEFCLGINVPIIVRKLVFTSRSDLENQARIKRFEALNQILKMYRFDKIALAHQMNDQAETILMNLFRGCGLNGMAGIRTKVGTVIHPMLCFGAVDVHQILKIAGIEARQDSTNALPIYNRNRVRHEIIPKITEHFNPAFIERATQQSSIFRLADTYVREKAAGLLKKIIIEHLPEGSILDISKLKSLHEIESYYCLKHIFAMAAGTNNDFFMNTYSEIIRIMHSDGSKEKILSHQVLIRKQYEELMIINTRGIELEERPEPLVIEEDRTRAVYQNFRFTFKHLKVIPKEADGAHVIPTVIIDAEKIRFPFSIRTRVAGDRFVPIGMQHSKKLKEFFIDEKVAVFERDKVPIMDDGEKIFWVVPFRISDLVKRDESSSRFLQITAEHIDTGRKRQAARKKHDLMEENDESNEL